MKKCIQRVCKKHGETDFIIEGRGYYRCKRCRVDNVYNRRKRVKAQLVLDFGGKCTICGYDRCVENLTFHHRDPTKKDFGISEGGVTISYKRLKAEANKCVMLCCRCHGEVHAGLVSIPV